MLSTVTVAGTHSGVLAPITSLHGGWWLRPRGPSKGTLVPNPAGRVQPQRVP